MGAGAPFKVAIEIGGAVGKTLDQSIKIAQRKVSSLSQNVARTISDTDANSKRQFRELMSNGFYQSLALGAAAVGTALVVATKQASDFQDSLMRIGQITGQSGQELEQLGTKIAQWARTSGQSQPMLATGFKELVGRGLETAEAERQIVQIGKVATATGAAIEEVAATSFQMTQSFGISAEKQKRSWDALAAAGRAGAFELKDMAQNMPELGSAWATLNYADGEAGLISLAAAMQMVRREAPNAEEATTNMNDAILKLNAPQTVTNFKKLYGVNLEELMNSASMYGLNPFEVVLDKMAELTGGSGRRIAELFPDKQASAGWRALIKNREAYYKLRDSAGGKASEGEVDRLMEQRKNTLSYQVDSLKTEVQNFSLEVGKIAVPKVRMLVETVLLPMSEALVNIARENPSLTMMAVGIAGVASALVAAAPAILMTTMALKGLGVTSAAALLNPWVLAIAGITTGLVIAYDKVGWFRQSVDASFLGMSRNFHGLWSIAVGAFTGDQKKINTGIDELKVSWEGYTTTMGKVFPDAMALIKNEWALAKALWTGDYKELGKEWELMSTGMEKAWNVSVDAITNRFADFVVYIQDEALPALAQAVEKFAQTAWDKFVNPPDWLNAAIAAASGGTTTGRILNASPESSAAGPAQLLFEGLGGVEVPAGGGVPGFQMPANKPMPWLVPEQMGPPAPDLWSRARERRKAQKQKEESGSTPRPAGRLFGGAVIRNSNYIVNERIGEAFSPKTSGQVLPDLEALTAPTQDSGGKQQAKQVSLNVGGITINGASGDTAGITRAIQDALEQLRYDLQSSHRLLLND